MKYHSSEDFKKTNGHVIGDLWYPRVTKILEIKSKPALNIFFKEVGSYENAENIKNKSAEEGTLLHQTIQDFLLGKLTSVPGSLTGALEAFERFNEKQNILLHQDFVERPVWSVRHRYSGTVDALASIGSKFGVLDIKTSTGFYPEYNLQTSAYVSALQEFEIKKILALPRNIETRWILRIDQKKICRRCRANLREKGGRKKIRSGLANSDSLCPEKEHEWGELAGEVEIRELPYYYRDFRAFTAAKILWEWENDYWLKKIGYLR